MAGNPGDVKQWSSSRRFHLASQLHKLPPDPPNALWADNQNNIINKGMHAKDYVQF